MTDNARAGVDVFGLRRNATREGRNGNETVLHSDHGGELIVQGGPRPYLWIGGKDNRCVATVETDLRALRDAITQALRNADREAMADA